MHPFGEYIELAKLFWPSLLTALSIAVAAGVIGVFVLLRRDAMAALAIPQLVAVGAAVALRMGFASTLWPSLAAVVAALTLLVWSKRRGANHWLLPSLYIAGLSISFLIVAGSGGHVGELQALFTGVDVAVSPEQARLATPVLLIAAGACAVLWRRLLLISQAPAVAEVAGVSSAKWELTFLALLAIVFLLGTSSSGIVMVLALLFLPAATVLPWARRVPIALAASAVLAVLVALAAWVLSIRNDWPLSPAAGGVGFSLLLTSHLSAALWNRST